METAWIVSLIAVNACALIVGIMSYKSIKINKYLNKAEKNAEGGNKSNALTYLDKALKISPKNINALTNKAVVLRDMGENHYDEAIEYYNKALVLAQDEALITTINYHLGVLYCDMGKYFESKKYYEKALENNNLYSAEFWNNLGILHYHLNDKQEALRCFEKSLLIAPNYSLAEKNKKALLNEINNY